jgi:hypothetical protein
MVGLVTQNFNIGWECPRCHTVWAPSVPKCSCSVVELPVTPPTVVPYWPGPTWPYVPTNPPWPSWPLPNVTCEVPMAPGGILHNPLSDTKIA